jgi:hypothetical protein
MRTWAGRAWWHKANSAALLPRIWAEQVQRETIQGPLRYVRRTACYPLAPLLRGFDRAAAYARDWRRGALLSWLFSSAAPGWHARAASMFPVSSVG